MSELVDYDELIMAHLVKAVLHLKEISRTVDREKSKDRNINARKKQFAGRVRELLRRWEDLRDDIDLESPEGVEEARVEVAELGVEFEFLMQMSS